MFVQWGFANRESERKDAMTKKWEFDRVVIWGLMCSLAAAAAACGADRPQWGERHTRNGVSDEKGLADRFDPATGENIKWVAQLGSESWATPVVAGGRVFMGTNSDPPRDPRYTGDRGI